MLRQVPWRDGKPQSVESRPFYNSRTTWQLSRLLMAAALALMTIARDICVLGDESQKIRTTTVGVYH